MWVTYLTVPDWSDYHEQSTGGALPQLRGLQVHVSGNVNRDLNKYRSIPTNEIVFIIILNTFLLLGYDTSRRMC